MEGKKYPSRYNPGKMISPLHYIVELICEKNARYTKKEIPPKFWNLPIWGQFYRFQMSRAKALLEHYSDTAIIQALNDKRMWNVYSLQAKWLLPVIQEYQDKLNLIVPKQEGPEMSTGTYKRKTFKKNNILEELDG